MSGYSLGASIYNYSRQEYDSDGAYTDRNQFSLQKGWKRWRQKGDIATHPAAAYNNPSNANKASTRYLESSDFLKLRSLTLGYNFHLKSDVVKALRVYVSGETSSALLTTLVLIQNCLLLTVAAMPLASVRQLSRSLLALVSILLYVSLCLALILHSKQKSLS